MNNRSRASIGLAIVGIYFCFCYFLFNRFVLFLPNSLSVFGRSVGKSLLFSVVTVVRDFAFTMILLPSCFTFLLLCFVVFCFFFLWHSARF